MARRWRRCEPEFGEKAARLPGGCLRAILLPAYALGCAPRTRPRDASPPHPRQAGCIPILHMRGFQKGGKLPDALVEDIVSRHQQ